MSARRSGRIMIAAAIFCVHGALGTPAAAAAEPAPDGTTEGAGSATTSGRDLLLVSDDGVTFTPSAERTLFDSAGEVVPADRISDSLWFRNGADTPGRLRVDLVAASSGEAFADALTFAVHVAGAAAREPIPFRDAAGRCTVMSDGLVLSPGATTRVDVIVTVDATLGDRPGDSGMGQSVDFRLHGLLSDVAAGPQGGCGMTVDQPALGPTAPLATTGSTPPALPLALGFAGAVIGTCLILLSRAVARRRGAHPTMFRRPRGHR